MPVQLPLDPYIGPIGLENPGKGGREKGKIASSENQKNAGK